MFGIKTKTSAPVRPASLPRRAPGKIGHLDEYLALAHGLNIASATRGLVLQHEVADFLWEHDIEMYDYDDVVNFLGEVAPKGNNVYWRPLRDVDVTSDYNIGNKDDPGYYDDKEWNCRTYDKIIPIEILRNVKLLVEKFGDKLQFFVSDFASPNPDPFIMATARDMTCFVFGVWDGPGFSLLISAKPK